MEIEEIRLIYAQEEENEIHLSIFYDEEALDYSRTEIRIFDAYSECDNQFPDIYTEILVMIYQDSIDIPSGSEILLPHLMRNCPRCKRIPVKIQRLDIHLLLPDDKKLYDRLYQCTNCLSVFQHTFWKKSHIMHMSARIAALSFLHHSKKTGVWR